MPDAVSARAVTVERDGRTALRDVSFVAARGQITAIVGPNGAGKSTLLRCIAGLLPHAGAIALEGQDCASMTPRERARLFAFVPQQSQLRAPLPVIDVVAQGRYARAPGRGALQPDDHAAVHEAMRVAEVSALAERPFTELSGGEQRRVLVARALAAQAPVLLLDEPTASLDVRHALTLHEIARAQAERGAAVVMVLHALGDVLRHADHALLLSAGKLVAAGAPRDVIDERAVADVYGVRLVPDATPGFERLRT